MKYIILLMFMFLLSGCWEQDDVVSINSDGITEFESTIKITEVGLSLNEVEELADEFLKFLTKAGWVVERSWISKNEPYQFKVSGKGNIKEVEEASDFYTIQKVEDDKIQIRFRPAESNGGKSSRSIKFKTSYFNGVSILDEQGNKVKEIKNVDWSNVYTIIF